VDVLLGAPGVRLSGLARERERPVRLQEEAFSLAPVLPYAYQAQITRVVSRERTSQVVKLNWEGHSWPSEALIMGHHAIPAAAPLPVLSFQRTTNRPGGGTSRTRETLRLPVMQSSRQYDALVEACSRACVGAGDKTVVNLDVRRCWHLLPDDFTIDNAAEWGRALQSFAFQLREKRFRVYEEAPGFQFALTPMSSFYSSPLIHSSRLSRGRARLIKSQAVMVPSVRP